MLTEKKQKLRLNWAPRDQNYEADELSNGFTHRFSSRNEVKVEPILRQLKVFNKVIKYGRRLYDEVDERQAFAAEDSYRTWMLYNRITSKTGLKIPTPDEGRFKAWEDRRRSRSPPPRRSSTARSRWT